MIARKPLDVDGTPGAADGAPHNADVGPGLLLYPVWHPHSIRLATGLLIIVAGMFFLALHGSIHN